MECSICKKTYSATSALNRHMKQQHSSQKQFNCHMCPLSTNRKDVLKIHLKKHEKNEAKMAQQQAAVLSKKCEATNNEPSTSNDSGMIKCRECQVDVNKKNMSAHLKTLFHKKHCSVSIGPNVKLINSAFNKNICTYRISSAEELMTNVSEFMAQIKPDVLNLIKKKTNEQENGMKINFELFASYLLATKQNEDGNDIQNETKSFNSKYRIVTVSSDLEDMYLEFSEILKVKSEEFQVSHTNSIIRFIISKKKYFILAKRFRMVNDLNFIFRS